MRGILFSCSITPMLLDTPSTSMRLSPPILLPASVRRQVAFFLLHVRVHFLIGKLLVLSRLLPADRNGPYLVTACGGLVKNKAALHRWIYAKSALPSVCLDVYEYLCCWVDRQVRLRMGRGSRPRTRMYDIIRPRDLIFTATLFAFAVVCVYMHVYRHVCTRVRT
jgi:hypothetical protein